MLAALAAGAALGLSAGLSPGPLLALVITQTLKHGKLEGAKVALAPLATDAPIIVVSLVLLTRLAAFERVLGAVSLAGGLYVLYLAWECMRAGGADVTVGDEQPRSIRKGVLVNFLNPHVYLFWISVGGPLLIRYDAVSRLKAVAFLACFYVLLVGSKMALAVVVGHSREFLKGRGYTLVMRLLGAALAVFGVLLGRDALRLLGV